ncbi:hypothetical protein NDU88_004344 [Pleurodeles waltl]|uniref:Uncharacterized protein n=1 Tax=Pleurodeles waltl TaxID=8319 RepID=A0AAV7LLE8_PLEWA|nr:hypothetical protein NDU88_004344 [Pleurodeles waltl]
MDDRLRWWVLDPRLGHARNASGAAFCLWSRNPAAIVTEAPRCSNAGEGKEMTDRCRSAARAGRGPSMTEVDTAHQSSGAHAGALRLGSPTSWRSGGAALLVSSAAGAPGITVCLAWLRGPVQPQGGLNSAIWTGCWA